MTLPFFAVLPLLIVKQNPSDRSLEYKIFYHSTLVLCHLCKTRRHKTARSSDLFMSTIQCQAFTKQASHQTHLQSQKCFHICSTSKKTEAAVNQSSILSPNCLLAVQTWSTNWRGGEEDRLDDRSL